MVNYSIVIRIAAVSSWLSALSVLLGMPIAAGLRGVGGPGPIDFGSGEVLTQLSMAAPRTIWVDTLALIGPVLALPAGAGWFLILGHQRPLAALGTLLWYLAVVFVIAQDAFQLALVTTLPPAYATASAAIKPAIEAFGGSFAYVITVVAMVGHYLNTTAILILAVAMIRSPRIPKWIAILCFTSATIGLLSASAQLILPQFRMLGIGVPVSILLFVLVCIPCLGDVMWRWKYESSAAD